MTFPDCDICGQITVKYNFNHHCCDNQDCRNYRVPYPKSKPDIADNAFEIPNDNSNLRPTILRMCESCRCECQIYIDKKDEWTGICHGCATSSEDDEISILIEANNTVHYDRMEKYGHPLDDYTRTAALWSAILGVEITAEQALLCMVTMKLSRECNGHLRDNLVDAAGYLECLDLSITEREKRNAESNDQS